MIYKFELYEKKTYGIMKTRIKRQAMNWQTPATYKSKNGYYLCFYPMTQSNIKQISILKGEILK